MFVHIFDCDGVITDTNELKTKAFNFVAKKYLSDKASKELLEFHKKNLGKSRWEKFNFIKAIGLNENYKTEYLCEEYANFIESSIYDHPLVPRVKDYLESIINKSEDYIYVASGGESEQVKRLLKHHRLNIHKKNIFGSPEKKIDIVKKIKKKHENLNFVLYGDSFYDAECAKLIKSKFIFVSGYTTCDTNKILNNYSIDMEIKDFNGLNLNKIKEIF